MGRGSEMKITVVGVLMIVGGVLVIAYVVYRLGNDRKEQG
jgi:hypothetical protein